MGNQRVMFQAPLKIDIWYYIILVHSKIWNEFYECKNSIFMNINQINVI
jgi:hypothetical protein